MKNQKIETRLINKLKQIKTKDIYIIKENLVKIDDFLIEIEDERVYIIDENKRFGLEGNKEIENLYLKIKNKVLEFKKEKDKNIENIKTQIIKILKQPETMNNSIQKSYYTISKDKESLLVPREKNHITYSIFENGISTFYNIERDKIEVEILNLIEKTIIYLNLISNYKENFNIKIDKDLYKDQVIDDILIKTFIKKVEDYEITHNYIENIFTTKRADNQIRINQHSIKIINKNFDISIENNELHKNLSKLSHSCIKTVEENYLKGLNKSYIETEEVKVIEIDDEENKPIYISKDQNNIVWIYGQIRIINLSEGLNKKILKNYFQIKKEKDTGLLEKFKENYEDNLYSISKINKTKKLITFTKKTNVDIPKDMAFIEIKMEIINNKFAITIKDVYTKKSKTFYDISISNDIFLELWKVMN